MGFINVNYKKKEKASIDMEQIQRDMKKYPQKEPVEYNGIDISKSFCLDTNAFFEDFNNLNTMPDNQLQQFVLSSYIQVLNMVPLAASNPEYSHRLMQIISNDRYINILTNVLGNNPLDYTHKIYLNHLIYDYIMFKGINTILMGSKMIYRLADVANSDILHRLYQTGFDRDMLSLLCICRNSSLDESINVKRVNLTLFNSNRELTLQNVVDVYQTLFNTSVSKLFEGIMFDVYSKEELDNATDNQKNIYSLMGLAVLELLNVMPSESIQIILSSYVQGSYGKPIRFSMKLSEDYWRINEVIEKLYSQGIYVP